jgi:hypothetical protein
MRGVCALSKSLNAKCHRRLCNGDRRDSRLYGGPSIHEKRKRMRGRPSVGAGDAAIAGTEPRITRILAGSKNGLTLRRAGWALTNFYRDPGAPANAVTDRDLVDGESMGSAVFDYFRGQFRLGTECENRWSSP